MTSQQDSAKLSISWLDTQHNCSVPWACSCVHIVYTLPQQQLFSSASEKLFLITTLAMNECKNDWREIAESLTICVWQLSVILSQYQDSNKAQCEVEWRRNWRMKSNLYNIHILYFPPLNKDYYFDSLLCLSYSPPDKLRTARYVRCLRTYKRERWRLPWIGSCQDTGAVLELLKLNSQEHEWWWDIKNKI